MDGCPGKDYSVINKLTNLFLYFWKNTFFRFLFIGGVNTVFGYSVFSILVFFRVHYSLALLLATILGVLFNFKTLGMVVFRDGDNRKIFRFVLVYVILYFVNVGIVGTVKHFGVSTYAAGAIAVLPVALLGFILNNRFVYNK